MGVGVGVGVGVADGVGVGVVDGVGVGVADDVGVGVADDVGAGPTTGVRVGLVTGIRSVSGERTITPVIAVNTNPKPVKSKTRILSNVIHSTLRKFEVQGADNDDNPNGR